MQRSFDILFSTLALILLSPLMVPIALMLRLTGEGEIFFIQERVGENGQVFGLFKFATMLKNSPNIGTGTITVKGDPRILPLGGFLRKSKINELPQLLNIFLGHMSFIGPRPLTNETFSLYTDSTQVIIKQTRPGLSGVQQVVIRNEEDLVDAELVSEDFYKSILVPYKGKLEEWFVCNDKLYIYFLCILMTIWIIITPKNSLVWRVFKRLPEPPEELKEALSYISK